MHGPALCVLLQLVIQTSYMLCQPLHVLDSCWRAAATFLKVILISRLLRLDIKLGLVLHLSFTLKHDRATYGVLEHAISTGGFDTADYRLRTLPGHIALKTMHAGCHKDGGFGSC